MRFLRVVVLGSVLGVVLAADAQAGIFGHRRPFQRRANRCCASDYSQKTKASAGTGYTATIKLPNGKTATLLFDIIGKQVENAVVKPAK